MSHRSRVYLVRSIAVLMSVAALWALASQILPALQLRASDADLAPLTFRSPVGNPELRVGKTVDEEAPRPGDVIEYTLAYSTTHPGSQAYNVRLYDFLPAGVDFVSSSPPAHPSDGVLVFSADSVGAETQSVRVWASVRAGFRELRNEALVLADFVEPAYHSLSTAVTGYPARLRLDKLGTTAALAGGELVYRLRCENDGDAEASSVTLIDVLPDDVAFVAASPPPGQIEPFLRWTVGDLAPQESFAVVITATAPSATGVITNAALADAVEMVLSQQTLATDVVAEGAILQVTKAGSAPTVDLGDELKYTLRYENTGNLPASDVQLTDTLPPGVHVTDASPEPDESTADRLVWDLGSLGPDDPAGTVVVTVEVGGSGGRWLHNRVDITGGPGTFPGYDEERTWVRRVRLFLPLVLRGR